MARFEDGGIAPDAFHHADHVKLAFAYLQKYPVLEALGRFSAALKRFAASQGKADRYHETITFAYFFLIRERMACGKDAAWEQFALDNADLFAWESGILKRYYEESTLKSELARSTFLLPDKR